MLKRSFYILIYSICLLKILSSLNASTFLYATTPDPDCYDIFVEYSTPINQTLLNDVKTKGVFKIIPEDSRTVFEEALFNYYTTKKNLNLSLVFSSHIQKKHFDYSLFGYHSRLFTNSLLNIKNQPSYASTPDFLQNLGYRKVADFYVFTSLGGVWTRGGGKTIKAKMPLNIKKILTKKAHEFFSVTNMFFKAGSVVNKISLLPSIAYNYSQTELNSQLTPEQIKILNKILDLYKVKKAHQLDLNDDNKIDDEAICLEIAQEILSQYNLDILSDMCERISEALSTTAEELIENMYQEPQAINIIDLKIAYVSVLSRVTQSYIPLDFWTGPHSHTAFKRYLEEFKNEQSPNSYKFKTYTNNPVINSFIVESISQYLQASDKLSFSLIFGYSELLPPISNVDVDSRRVIWQDSSPQKGTPYMSSFLDYLKQTGRQTELTNLGVKYLLFNNLEVLGPINLEIHAFRHILNKKPQYNSAFILVPRGPHYKGGFGLFTNDSKKIIVEESNVDESIRDGYIFFNTNTAMFNLDTITSAKTIGFEKKSSFIKVKGNLGDISFTNETALIEGAIEENYFNFKGYGDYIDNGEKFLEHFTKWMEYMFQFHRKHNRK